MSLDLSVTQAISCEAVVAIAEDAAKAILDVYDSKVRHVLCWTCSSQQKQWYFDLYLCRTRIGASR